MEIEIGNEKKSLAVFIKDYEFKADKVDDDYDKNFLTLGFRYRNGEKVRECTDPCLLTWELCHIIGGLEEVLDGTSEGFNQDDIWMVEPNLMFSVTAVENGLFMITVDFGSGDKLGKDDPVARVSQKVDSKQLRRIITKLRIGQRSFPMR